MIHPSRALDEVMPWIKSVYTKSLAPRKKALEAFLGAGNHGRVIAEEQAAEDGRPPRLSKDRFYCLADFP